MAVRDLGIVTAYGYAVAGGYTGTEQEFTALLGDLALTVEDLENMTVSVTTLEPNQQATASYADGVLSLGIPKGVAGEVQFSDLEPLAEKDGNYENFTAGSALQLISDKYTEDQVPYLFRKSGGGKSIGNREIDKIVGGSVAWNQAWSESYLYTSSSGLSVSAQNHVINITGTPNAVWANLSQTGANNRISLTKNHVYCELGTANGATINFTGFTSDLSANVFTVGLNRIIKNTTAEVAVLRITDLTVGQEVSATIKGVGIFDLTQMFGTAVADRLYAMEQANAGSGVALFRSWFPKEYYAYNTGELMSVKTTAHEMVGFNQWDEEWESGYWDATDGLPKAGESWVRSKNMIPCLPSTEYCYRDGGTAGSVGYVLYYDASGQYLGSYSPLSLITFTTHANARYMSFYTSAQRNVDICISFSSDRNGEYQPYTKHTYPLDDIELRGVPKLDGTGIYFDGDTYEADGTVTRKYGIVDMGTLTWFRDNVDNNWGFYLGINALPNAKVVSTMDDKANFLMPKYTVVPTRGNTEYATDGVVYQKPNTQVFVVDKSYTDATAFKTAMSGVYLVYELATPTTETADPFTSPQIVDAYGTERYVDERTVAVPVGHVTKYPDNLREKLDGLPWDFSSLIAPTEKAYTATRNYTAGSLLIVNNILYKVTANIANGGTITPNTNCTATTLAEVISAL